MSEYCDNHGLLVVVVMAKVSLLKLGIGKNFVSDVCPLLNVTTDKYIMSYTCRNVTFTVTVTFSKVIYF